MLPLNHPRLIPEDDRLEHARVCSPFLAGLIDRHPDWLAGLNREGRLDHGPGPSKETLEQMIGDHNLDAGLRQFRNREMLRIVWRDLSGLARLEETMADLTGLAETCLDTALAHHSLALREKHGTPRNADGLEQKLVVIGMGKLGGLELNLSSDIDIILCFPENGSCDGPRAMANAQFFTRLSRAMIKSLSEITSDGFCFRVDTRLRPFGESGPLCCSFDAMEQYYQREGRDWERYALVKARIVGGDRDAGNRLLNLLKPFVYRRYIDYGAVEGLREMRATVQQDAARKEMQGDVKRGPGGIREIEFLVQGFQLLRGGRETELQTPSLLTAIRQLDRLGQLQDGVATEIISDYHFLRDLENRIQAQRDQQTHSLPGEADLERLVLAMHFPDKDTLISRLESVRKRVRNQFDACFPGEQDTPEPDSGSDSTNWSGQWEKLKSESGEDDADPALLRQKPVNDFVSRIKRQALSQRASQRLDRFMPLLLSRITARQMGNDVLDAVLDLVLAISRRSAYLALLLQNPPALERMLDLFAASDWIAARVTRFPALLDELIDPSLGRSLPTAAEISATVERILQTQPDPEAALLGLNHVKRAFQLRIAVAELETTLNARAVQHALTELAEALVRGILSLSRIELEKRHGCLPDSPLAIVGYGTLGAAELGYTSDLDLVFLFRAGKSTSDGLRPLPPEQYHTRLARRVLSFLTAPTASGRLYETDMRLRPNGRSGLLVSSLSAFADYQSDSAWTWEWQALTRARWVAGDSGVGVEFSAVRRDVLRRPRDRNAVLQDIHDMRARIRTTAESEKTRRPDPYKHNPGGLVDIEFIAQYGTLVHASGDSRLLNPTDTIGQLETLGECGFLSENERQLLVSTHEKMTRGRHLSRLRRQTPNSNAPIMPGDEQVAQLFDRIFSAADR